MRLPPALKLDVLFGNLTEMVEFQVEFLKTLEDGTRLVPDLEKLERVDQFKVPQKRATGLPKHAGRPPTASVCNSSLSSPQKILFSLGGSFLYYADRFKIYSAFCASHTKVPKVLVKGECVRPPPPGRRTSSLAPVGEHVFWTAVICP